MKRFRSAAHAPVTGWLFPLLLVASPLVAQTPTTPTTTTPPIRTMVGLDQHLDAQLPLTARFTDAAGASVTLGEVVRDRPAVLQFGYFTCPELCGVTIEGTLDALRQTQPGIGEDFDFVYISIDPADTVATAAEKQMMYARRYGRERGVAGWHFLTGDEATIERVTRVAGFRFQAIAGTGQFAHPSGFLVVRPDGVISRYFPGIDFRPVEIAAALREAAAGHTGQKVFDLLLVCFSGGLRPGIARTAFLALQVACGLTVLGLATGIGRMLYREHRHARSAPAREDAP